VEVSSGSCTFMHIMCRKPRESPLGDAAMLTCEELERPSESTRGRGLRRWALCAAACALVVVVACSAAVGSDGSREVSTVLLRGRRSHPRRGAMSKQVSLIKWAEKHGLPKSLANNPKDQSKVKNIIARMKADLVVERIQAQMKKDDSTVCI